MRTWIGAAALVCAATGQGQASPSQEHILGILQDLQKRVGSLEGELKKTRKEADQAKAQVKALKERLRTAAEEAVTYAAEPAALAPETPPVAAGGI